MIKVPINCPICNDPLVNTYNEHNDSIIYKNCRLRPDHIFTCVVFFAGSLAERVERFGFTLSMSPAVSVVVNEKTIWVGKVVPDGMSSIHMQSQPLSQLPYFEMDFTDYKKLVNKIKTYLLFS